MSLDPIVPTSGLVSVVSTNDEFYAAAVSLSNTPGGGRIEIEPGTELEGIWLSGSSYGGEPLVITSSDPEQLAETGSIYMAHVSNIRIENISVDSSAWGGLAESWREDLWIKESDNIQIVDTVFSQDHLAPGQTPNSMADIRTTDNLLFEGNSITGYFHGLQVTEGDGIVVAENDISALLGDGIRMGGVQNVEITNNYIHDMVSTPYSVNHADMIQFWGTNTYSLTENVLISGNILDTGDGAASQGIFIRNEKFGVDDETGGYLKNFTITDNLIYNGHQHGIRVDDVDGYVISNNTLLWDQDSSISYSTGSKSAEPGIWVKNTLNGEITDNITHRVRDLDDNDDFTSSGNYIINYTDPGSQGYVDNHFVNVLQGSEGGLADLFLLPTSPLNDTAGSYLSVAPTVSPDGVLPIVSVQTDPYDAYVMSFDASMSVDETGALTASKGYSFFWSFSDGSTDEGVSVTKVFDGAEVGSATLSIRQNGDEVVSLTRGYEIFTQDIFAFDFEDGVVDISDGNPIIVEDGIDPLRDSDDGTGFRIGDGERFKIDKYTENMSYMDSFGLTLDIKLVGDEHTGAFMDQYGTMDGWIGSDGYVYFTINTDTGRYTVETTTPLSVGETHTLGVAFDGGADALSIYVDGELSNSTFASGITSRGTTGLVFGRNFGDSVDAIIDNVAMSTNPAIAGQPVQSNAEDGEDEDETVPPGPTEEPKPEPEPGESAEEPASEPEPDEVDVPDSPIVEAKKEEEEDSDNGFFAIFSIIFELFAAIFGGGRDKDKDSAPADPVETVTSEFILLSDVVPSTSVIEDDDVDEFQDRDEDAGGETLAA
ncbi:MAG: right-handed parallel beta-helix repeat-containing protein [Pseudomonadota bacterium]